MTLLELYTQIQQQESIDIPEGWLQGRTIYGGFAAAMLMQKALSVVQDPAKQLLSCHITFVGPIQQDRVQLTAEILREGKSVTTVEVRLWQNEAVQTLLVASFGAKRHSKISVNPQQQAPDFSAPDVNNIFPLHPLIPQCMHHMQLCYVEGQLPCTASTTPDFSGWMRFHPEKHPNRAMTLPDLVIAFDMWPPGVLSMLTSIAPASSLTWQITYLAPLENQLHDWMKYQVKTEAAEDGYSHERAYLWDANNRLIAIAHQTVTIFD